jgi:hypothetical protein
MPEPKQTVESIRAFLGSKSTTVSAPLIAVAADYAQMCGDANFRLRRCADFLREGLAGEALAHAAIKPPLLDLVSDLKFRELGEWERTCAALGLARPGGLAVDAAANLIEAGRRQEPLTELLAKHRYLALARADLPTRLSVLRQLAAADPTSPCWNRQVEELTRARVANLRGDATAAIHAGDLAAVNRLLAEMNAGTIAAPADLKQMLARASETLHESAAIARLRALVPQVRIAVAARSYEECREVFAKWGAVVKESRLNVPPDLRQEILPLSQWLDEMDDLRERERKFRQACGALKQALEAHAPLEQLADLYRAAGAFDLDMPPELFTAYRRATDAFRRAARREKLKQFLITAALLGVIAAALAALGYVVFGKHM